MSEEFHENMASRLPEFAGTLRKRLGVGELAGALILRGQQTERRKRKFQAHEGMLKDADGLEQELLGAVRYQPNRAILHTDRRFLPQRESLWSAWNYLSLGEEGRSVCVTYLLNRLQRLPFDTPLMVTLNPPQEMAPRGEIASYDYDHPIFDQAAIDAQSRLASIQGRNRTWYCGAWCGYGFHEDGLKSALRIIGDFGVEAPWPAAL